ncbi:MAG: flagellin [Thalassobaculales bacterium]
MAAGANSINTNPGALVALQNLGSINKRLDSTQNRVSTGFKVNNAVEDASSFAIAQGTRANLKAYEAVSQGISNARGVATVALSAATSISDLLGDIQKKVTEGMNAANTTGQQAILNTDFQNLVTQVNQFITNAVYNGRNLLSTGSDSVSVIANIDGSTLKIRSASNAGNAATTNFAAAVTLATTTNAAEALSKTVAMIASIGTLLGQLGADTRTIDFQDDFIGKLSDATETGLGAIVDADLAKESAKLQALQVQQQLSVQTLNIANQRPSVLLSLFR